MVGPLPPVLNVAKCKYLKWGGGMFKPIQPDLVKKYTITGHTDFGSFADCGELLQI